MSRNWRAYLEDCLANPSSHARELGDDRGITDPSAGISYVCDRLSPDDRRSLVAAALTLIQDTRDPEMLAGVQSLPFELLDAESLIGTLEARGDELPAATARALLAGALRAHPGDPRLRARASHEASRPGNGPAILELAIAHLPAWVAANLARFATPELDPLGTALVGVTLAAHHDRESILDAIAAAGSEYVARFRTGLNASQFTDVVRDALRPVLMNHPAFA